MTRRTAVLKVVARMPSGLRVLRAKLMLEPLCEALGVEETACPACAGSGWLDERTLVRCPLCAGFREVPVRLADWFEDEMRALRLRVLPGRSRAYEAVGEPDDSRPPDPEIAATADRWGRLAARTYRVLLPAHD